MKLFLLFLLVVESLADGPELPVLNIDMAAVSVSGISSGACFATQYHVAYSASVMGMGMNAGAPYYCARGSSITAVNQCMNNPANVDVGVLRQQAENYASAGDIDRTGSLAGDKVAIFHGDLDSVVNKEASFKTMEFYELYNTDRRIETSVPAEHTFPTIDYGNQCSYSGSPYLGRCGYSCAGYILNHIYGLNLALNETTRPTKMATLQEFDQEEFFYISNPGASSMDRRGYVYVPTACASGALCKLHIVFHGCNMGRDYIGNEFALHGGYNEIAEANNIVVLYPQVVRSLSLPSNPQGCWDWWGYTINKYATKGANQPLAVARMVDKIANANIAPSNAAL